MSKFNIAQQIVLNSSRQVTKTLLQQWYYFTQIE